MKKSKILEIDIRQYWTATLAQNAAEMRAFFHNNASVNWHNTNEHFTVDEFIRANCEYPGTWSGQIERIEESGSLLITVTHVFVLDGSASFHVTSFIAVKDGKIASIDEYWGDDGEAPQWRREEGIGTPIRG